MVREPCLHLLRRAVEDFQERDLVLNRIVRRLGLGEQVLGEEVVDRLGPGLGRECLVTLLAVCRSAAIALSRCTATCARCSASAFCALRADAIPRLVPTIPPTNVKKTRLAAITCPLFRLTNFFSR